MRDRFHWARLLAYVTGLVNQELLLRNEYLAAENRILSLCQEPSSYDGISEQMKGDHTLDRKIVLANHSSLTRRFEVERNYF